MRPAGPAPGAVPAGWRSAGSGWRCCGHSGSARNSSGAPTISALELTSGGYPRPGGAASGPLAARAGPLPLTPTPTGAVDELCQHGHAVVLLVWGRPWSVSAWEDEPRGTTVTGHNQAWLDRLLSGQRGGPGRRRHPGRQLTAEGNPPRGASCTTSHAAVPTPSLPAILPNRLPHTHSCRNPTERWR